MIGLRVPIKTAGAEVCFLCAFPRDLSVFVLSKQSVAMARMGRIYSCMNLLLILVILLLLFGGGGFYFGGPAYGGGGLGLILLICIIVFLMGGFRKK